MHSSIPRVSLKTLRRWTLAIAAMSPLLLAMRCANEDLTQRYELPLSTNGTPEIMGVQTPYTGRLSLDLSIQGSPGDVLVRVQAQTSGDPDIDGCDSMNLGRQREVIAGTWDGTSAPGGNSGQFPEVNNLTVRTSLKLNTAIAGGQYAGVVEAIGTTTLVRVYSSTPDVFMWDLRGNVIPPYFSTLDATCQGVFVTVFEMPSERVRLGFKSSEAQVAFAVNEDCTAQRIVQRICPGTSGPLEEYSLPLDENGFVVHRVENLGVGDTIIVEGECIDSCPALLSAYAWVEPLACRTHNECTGGRSCTSDGYCVKDPPPNCSTGLLSASTIAGILGALSLLLIRRRRSA